MNAISLYSDCFSSKTGHTISINLFVYRTRSFSAAISASSAAFSEHALSSPSTHFLRALSLFRASLPRFSSRILMCLPRFSSDSDWLVVNRSADFETIFIGAVTTLCTTEATHPCKRGVSNHNAIKTRFFPNIPLRQHSNNSSVAQ
jgi:hypothetical protein